MQTNRSGFSQNLGAFLMILVRGDFVGFVTAKQFSELLFLGGG